MLHELVICVFFVAIFSFATEALVEILVDSDITAPYRKKFKQYVYPFEPRQDTYYTNILVFIDKLISCGYCSSVWVAAYFSLLMPHVLDNPWHNWVCFTLVIHRISNWVHVSYKLWHDGRINAHDLYIKTTDKLSIVAEGSSNELREPGQSEGTSIAAVESIDSKSSGDSFAE